MDPTFVYFEDNRAIATRVEIIAEKISNLGRVNERSLSKRKRYIFARAGL